LNWTVWFFIRSSKKKIFFEINLIYSNYYLTIVVDCLTGEVARSTTFVFDSRFIGEVARVVVCIIEDLVGCSIDELIFLC